MRLCCPAPAGGPLEPLERRVLCVLYGPDISFAAGGVAAGVPGNSVLSDLPNGKILAIGVREFSSGGDLDVEMSAIRLNADSADTLTGGAGDDLLVSRDSLADQLFGSRGNDSALADGEDQDALL